MVGGQRSPKAADYLAVDLHDQPPFIVDQPEENLAPSSVFDELVPHLRGARKRRQVVIVTHDANLVVNTDADQVIVATSVRKTGGAFPGSTTRQGRSKTQKFADCQILEGGERAFVP